MGVLVCEAGANSNPRLTKKSVLATRLAKRDQQPPAASASRLTIKTKQSELKAEVREQSGVSSSIRSTPLALLRVVPTGPAVVSSSFVPRPSRCSGSCHPTRPLYPHRYVPRPSIAAKPFGVRWRTDTALECVLNQCMLQINAETRY